MTIKFSFTILVCFASVGFCNAQRPADPSDARISRRAADSITRNSFSRMVSGTEDVTNLANYLSFVPTDGKFSLAGNYFFQVHKKDTSKKHQEYFAVGFNGSGAIVGGTVATLFETGKLNTGVDVGLKFSWQMNKPHIGSTGSDNWPMREKRAALQDERNQKIDSVKNAIFYLATKLKRTELAIIDGSMKVVKAKNDSTRLVDSVRACRTDTCKLRFTDSLLATGTQIFGGQQKVENLKHDSVRLQEMYEVSQFKAGVPLGSQMPREQYLREKYGLNRISLTYEDTLTNKVWKEYEEKIFAVEMARPVAGMRINWLSGIFNWNRVNYRTYFAGLPFEQALVKKNVPGYTIGLQLNFYTFYKPVHTSRLFNAAVLFKRTSNLEDLTASKLVDEVVVTNGNTTRKASTEYSVYTDPVDTIKIVQVPLNYYTFFGKDLNFGWHAFATGNWRSDGKEIFDVGAGFIFGLNTAGAKRLFNIEVFAKYQDIKKEITDKEDSGLKQFAFGLSVAIPFMIYKN